MVGMWKINDGSSLTSLGAVAWLERTSATEPLAYFMHAAGRPASTAARW